MAHLSFSSIYFLFFLLPASVVSYALADRIFRGNINVLNVLLCLFWLPFYCVAGSQSVLVVLVLVLGNYLFAYVARMTHRSFLYIGIVLDVLVLAVFKYPQAIANALRSTEPITALFPLGISFIIFHCISYLADNLGERSWCPARSEAQEFLFFATYILFFPKLIQGPIVRYADMRPELASRSFSFNQLCSGCERILVGLVKKVLIADQLGAIVEAMPEPGSMDVATAWLGVLAFGLQLYLDFSGYSDMAIGLSRVFGFHFRENFNFPYSSTSVTEFWKRWHISLGAWFREYVYIPLGGSRRGSVYLNVFIVFLLTGMWHGNTWIYTCWGLAYGVICVLERTPRYKRLQSRRWFPVVGWVYTMLVVFIGWLCFRLPSLGSFLLYLKNMLGLGIGELSYTWRYFLTSRNITLLLVSILGIFFCGRERVRSLYQRLMRKPLCVLLKYILLLALFALCYAAILTDGYQPFLYFQY